MTGCAHGHGGHHHHGEMCTDALAEMELAFEAHPHEEAVAVTCTLHPRASCALPFSVLVERMAAAAHALEDAGAFIGHVKAFAASADENASASLTDLAIGADVKGDAGLLIGPGSRAQVVAIVIGLPLSDALALFRASLCESSSNG